MKTLKLWIVTLLPFALLLLTSTTFAQEAETVSAAPAGTELGVLLAGAAIVVAVGAYLAVNTKSDKKDE
jgi:hypothetical protein